MIIVYFNIWGEWSEGRGGSGGVVRGEGWVLGEWSMGRGWYWGEWSEGRGWYWGSGQRGGVGTKFDTNDHNFQEYRFIIIAKCIKNVRLYGNLELIKHVIISTSDRFLVKMKKNVI